MLLIFHLIAFDCFSTPNPKFQSSFAKVSLSGNFEVPTRSKKETVAKCRSSRLGIKILGEKYLVCIQHYFHAKFVNSLLCARDFFFLFFLKRKESEIMNSPFSRRAFWRGCKLASLWVNLLGRGAVMTTLEAHRPHEICMKLSPGREDLLR